MYNFSFLALIRNLLPSFLRQGRMIVWLRCLLYPAELLYSEFLDYRNLKLWEASITGQNGSLEWMLNDEFYHNPNVRLIYIEDNTDFEDEVYLYNTSELETETYIFNTDETADNETYVFNSGEGTGGPDFTVWVLDTLTFDIDYMKSLLNKFKHSGTSYEIKTYTDE